MSTAKPFLPRITLSVISILAFACIALLRGNELRQISRERVIVITEGTAARIESGTQDSLFTHEIEMVLGVQDILVIRNEDIQWHTVGPYGIAPGATIVQQYIQPDVITQACTINPAGSITIVIRKRDTLFTWLRGQG